MPELRSGNGQCMTEAIQGFSTGVTALEKYERLNARAGAVWW